MRANLIYHDNGVGLTADAEIVSRRLRHLGFEVTRSECHDHRAPAKPCEVNVHLELFDRFWLDHAPTTYLIPNQEWLSVEWLPDLATLDAVLCKTRFAEQSLRHFEIPTTYIGFTSRDRYRPAVTKDYGKWLHFAGRSGQKGTELVLATWRANPGFPPLTIVHHPENRSTAEAVKRNPSPNIKPICAYLSEDEVEEIFNSHQVHVCPSETEGFGHSLNEALACKAVLVTTDAPPMNELVTGRWGVPVAWEKSDEDPRYPGITKRFRVTTEQLAAAVRGVMALSASARAAMGERARQHFLEQDRKFGKAFDLFMRKRHNGGAKH
jgi:glycosyltransferase involved in cell wall biosynthesis